MQNKEWNIVLACLASIWVYLLALAGAQTEADPSTTGKPAFQIDVNHNESSTSSIKITWEVTDDKDIYHFRVQSRKKDRSDIIRSPPLAKTRRDYIIQDLRTHADYEVCVYAHFRNDTDEKAKVTCVDMATLALIRNDSLIAVIVALTYIILMVLLGYLVWRYHKSKQEPENGDGSEAGNPAEEEKLNPEEKPQVYLAPPLDKAPRSSIEDENIPYITPPVDQLSDEEREYYQKSTLV